MQPLGITAAQIVVFNSIVKGKASAIGKLCNVLDYDSEPMTRLLGRIEKKGLIRHVPNPDDWRSYLIELTEESVAMVPKAIRLVQTVSAALLQGFNSRETAALKASLEKILENAAHIFLHHQISA